MWNFKGTLWNSTQNILPIHWKIGFPYNIEIFKSSLIKELIHVFWNTPQDSNMAIAMLGHQLAKCWLNSLTILKDYQSIFPDQTTLFKMAGDISWLFVSLQVLRIWCFMNYIMWSGPNSKIRWVYSDFAHTSTLTWTFGRMFMLHFFFQSKSNCWCYADRVSWNSLHLEFKYNVNNGIFILVHAYISSYEPPH